MSNGHPEPHGIRMWCLGNEMDGPWQLGHRSADDYGKIAVAGREGDEAARPLGRAGRLRLLQRPHADLRRWERVVLEHSYDDVDYVSCHAYYEELDGDTGSFLASAVNMDHFIDSVVATADTVRAELTQKKRINISFDEWNVWYLDPLPRGREITDIDDWPAAPRILEQHYSVLDAVVVGNLLISLLKHADRVTAASLAQLVNVIAPDHDRAGGRAWRQTTFFPFAVTSRLAVGSSLCVKLESETYQTTLHGEVCALDAVATHDPETGRSAVFLVAAAWSRRPASPSTWAGWARCRILKTHTLTDDDIYAAELLRGPRPGRARCPTRRPASTAVGLRWKLPPVSWTAIALG